MPTQQAERFSSYVPWEERIDGHNDTIEVMRDIFWQLLNLQCDCIGGQTFIKVTAI